VEFGRVMMTRLEDIKAQREVLKITDDEYQAELKDYDDKYYPPKESARLRKAATAKFFHDSIPRIFLKQFPTVYLLETDELISFDDGQWQPTEPILNAWLEAHNACQDAHVKFKAREKDEILEHVRDRKHIKMADFERAPPYCLPFMNGVLDVRKVQLRSAVPEDGFRTTFAVNWNPSATCPRIEKFLDDICTEVDADNNIRLENGEPVVNQTMRKALLQLVAYCLYRGHPLQHFFLLIGGGSNGKGVFVCVLRNLLGTLNVSGKSFAELSDSPFASADLVGKFANISGELTDNELKNTDVLKRLTGGDLISAQRKYEQPFTFVNEGKIIVASNKPPKTADNSRGFFRRPVIYNFKRVFEGNNDNKDLARELCKLAELEGLAVLAVNELREWLNADGTFHKDAKFANAKTADEIARIYEQESDSVAAFVYDCVEPWTDGDIEGQTDLTGMPTEPATIWVPKVQVYRAYCEYCERHTLIKELENPFFKIFPKKCVYAAEGNPRIDGARIHSYRGIRLIPHKDEVQGGSGGSGGSGKKSSPEPHFNVGGIAEGSAGSSIYSKSLYVLDVVNSKRVFGEMSEPLEPEGSLRRETAVQAAKNCPNQVSNPLNHSSNTTFSQSSILDSAILPTTDVSNPSRIEKSAKSEEKDPKNWQTSGNPASSSVEMRFHKDVSVYPLKGGKKFIGPFSAGSVAAVPRSEVETLLSHGLAEIVDKPPSMEKRGEMI